MAHLSKRILSVAILAIGFTLTIMAQFAPSRTDSTLLSEYWDTTMIVSDSLVATADSLVAMTDSIIEKADSAIDMSVMHLYKKDVVRKNCFFVVSKKELILSVYEVVGKDTVLAATFPICYGRNKGNKTKQGDGCTPECSMQKPFYILEIKDAHTWRHDFKDGRGSILAYGHWFMRLDLSSSDCNPNVRSNRSIGIHGSTNNAKSVPGQGSEGCIRLRDADLLVLHDRYAQVGQKVIIFPITHKKLSFEH